MPIPGADRRKEQCLRNVVTTSLYNDQKNIKMDQFLKFTPGLNDKFDDTDDPGDDVMVLFHASKPPGGFKLVFSILSYCINSISG